MGDKGIAYRSGSCFCCGGRFGGRTSRCRGGSWLKEGNGEERNVQKRFIDTRGSSKGEPEVAGLRRAAVSGVRQQNGGETKGVVIHDQSQRY